MYFTDRGIEELDSRRGEETVTLAELADRMRHFVDLNKLIAIAAAHVTQCPYCVIRLARNGEELTARCSTLGRWPSGSPNGV